MSRAYFSLAQKLDQRQTGRQLLWVQIGAMILMTVWCGLAPAGRTVLSKCRPRPRV